MSPITITPRNEAERDRILDLLDDLDLFPDMVDNPQPIRRMTMEEYRAMIDESIKAYEKGDYISHEQLGREMKSW